MVAENEIDIFISIGMRYIATLSRNSVLQQLKNFERWKDKVNYGSRWIAEETVFSSLKRVFREYVSAKKFPNMVKEMMLKASLYTIGSL